jgi:hypothetical protein
MVCEMQVEGGGRKPDARIWWAILSRSGSYVLQLYPAEVEHYRAHRRIALGPGEQLLGEFASAAAARAAISQHFGQQARSSTAST